MPSQRPTEVRASSFSFWVLGAFLIVLWIAGGASRADASGQVIVRLAAWICLVWYVITERNLTWRNLNMPAIAIMAIALVVGLQLVPLPPAVWTSLPGREVFLGTTDVLGGEQPWRPLSISPSATVNAVSSLVVPFVVAILAGRLDAAEHGRIAALVVLLVIAGIILALVEFTGRSIDQPFINDLAGAVSGNMANRNHFALFVAQGMVLLMAWASPRAKKLWMVPAIALTLVLFFLTILASGSRTGIVLGGLGLVLGLLVAGPSLGLRHRITRRQVIGAAVAASLLFAGIVAVTIVAGRADAILRLADLSVEGDVRGAVWPVVIEMIRFYFPAGTGFGTFDPAYRISEPQTTLALVYVNRVHNDWLEVILDGGLLGVALLGGGLIWFAMRSFRAWFPGSAVREEARLLSKAGSAAILLALIGSLTDYPARTPMIMGILALSAVWLSQGWVNSRSGPSRVGAARRFTKPVP